MERVDKMTDKDRLQEKIEIFSDADKRSRLTDAERAYCPTIEEAMVVLE